ncbi:hypothetical protein GCM10011514_26920 [Emticicia aquatilis]|uniref:DUF4595 domain-containing protein n=1 Tax=Emticicia aquatilis TaxID=1537369 RepID=A0A916YUG5_9BACT|nr:RHS repeat domain-containing protein [Emticicia aquatilis]GGD61510.1 hypothetical protein GCM10011514_26920 [Emticicia aquatilis]
MRKLLLLLTLSTFSLLILNSCEEENLITGASTNQGNSTNSPTTGSNTGTTTTTTKCYVKTIVEVEDGDTYTNKLAYNTKNLLTTSDQDGALSTYEYDANNRVTKLTLVDGAGVETYTYSYDSKGNMSNIKYTAKNTPVSLFITEYKLTTNASGQVSQVTAVTEDGNIDFILEYQGNNIKKLIASADGKKETLIENLTFDAKSNVFVNAGLAKANIPFIIVGAFFGTNMTKFVNANNVLTDKLLGVFSTDPVTTTYKYEYSKDNLPTKMTYIQIDGKDKLEGSATYTYDCK